MSKTHIADILKTGITGLPNWVNIPLLYLNPLREGVYGRAYRKFKSNMPNLDPDRMLIDMTNYAIKNVPFYRKRYKGLVISGIDQFKREIGFISRKDIDANWDDFVADGCEAGPPAFHSVCLFPPTDTSKKWLLSIIFGIDADGTLILKPLFAEQK